MSVLATAALLTTCTAVLAAEDPLWRFSGSAALSRVLDLSQDGLMLAEQEVPEPPAGLSLRPVFRRNGEERSLVIPEGFTHREVCRLSENGWAVGFATRPVGHPQGNQQACVWDYASGAVRLLELPEGFRGSCAFDIDAPATTVSGYLTGRDPPRLLPCVWLRVQDAWTCVPLSAPHPFNPFLTSGRVVISDDGQSVAGSLAVRIVEAPVPQYVNHLFTWKRTQDNSWPRRELAQRAVHLNNINNQGLVVGRITERGKRNAYLYFPDGSERVLPALPGDARNEATDVNNRGTVVGWSDDPPGPEGGTEAFLWRNGSLARLPLPAEATYSSALTITDDERVGGWLYWQASPEDPGQNYSFILQLEPVEDGPSAASIHP